MDPRLQKLAIKVKRAWQHYLAIEHECGWGSYDSQLVYTQYQNCEQELLDYIYEELEDDD